MDKIKRVVLITLVLVLVLVCCGLKIGDWTDEVFAERSELAEKIILDNKSLKIIENGTEIYSTQSHGLEFSSAYLYLQMSSHSNYPLREIYFDNVVVAAC